MPASLPRVLSAALLVVPLFGVSVSGQEPPDAARDRAFQTAVQPFFKTHCVRCHNVDKMTSGIRVDHLTSGLEDRQLPLWKGILSQVADEAMPPEGEPQPTAEERAAFEAWIRDLLLVAKSRPRPKNGSARRLTVAQYRNTLRDLLGLEDDLTDVLPPDAVSKDGFLNNGETLQLSPLLVEAYFEIADQALDLCLVDETQRPVIQNFRMDIGTAINPEPCPDNLILGANSHLLANRDFVVTQLTAEKPFAFEPFVMRTKYDFIEGYQGNDTVRGWRKYDSIYHAVFACLRGTEGYPLGRAYDVVPAGLLLRPAIPSEEIFGQQSTYGPRANFKISLRELPERGRFRVTVKAARYDDGLLLDGGARPQEPSDESLVVEQFRDASVSVRKAGVYQIDVVTQPSDKPELLTLDLGPRRFTGEVRRGNPADAEQSTAWLVVRLPAGELKLTAQLGDNARLRRVVLTKLDETGEPARRFLAFEKRTPKLGVHLGLRRDCGSTLAPVGPPQGVAAGDLQTFLFEGAIGDFASPDVEKDNVNYLAGIREIGVRSEYTDGRQMPRLLIRSVEFEGPFYDAWPPATHRRIFLDSPQKTNPPAYAREVLQAFATRAFRRPVAEPELAALTAVWKESFDATGDLRQSLKDALLVVLTSPQFLFLIEESRTPAAEPLEPYELASKLSYFLWNAPPDRRLLDLAAEGKLRDGLDAETERMIQDPRFHQFAREFTSQWLSLDKFDVVEVDRQRFPKLTRDVKTQLREEPIRFVEHLFRRNLPARNLIQSDIVVANEVVASYYGLGERTESGFEFVPIAHQNPRLGGVLAQAGILAGLSDGREPNPVKRGAWLARKIVAEPPDDPPPNVPVLQEETKNLSLRERLEQHRNVRGCAKCHAGIDPWGVPFEQYDAGGLFRTEANIDARSTLPDQTEVADVAALRQYLADDRIDQVAFSVLKHLATYAAGRSLSYNEVEQLREQGLQLKSSEYRMQDLVRFVVNSPVFLEK